MIISEIIEKKRTTIEEAKRLRPQQQLQEALEQVSKTSRFEKEISREHHINLIAEIKKASPSRGVLRHDLNPLTIASIYQMSGAQALSILTEEHFFLGSLEHIREVKAKVDLPILRKDFIIDPYQIYESSFYGAEAVLLIADILSKEELGEFYDLSAQLGLSAVVEVHNEEDLQKALAVNAKIIGINNRDLHTFHVDLQVTTRLIKAIPQGKLVISESGIKSHEDIMFLKSIGVHAVLVGETFMVARDIGAKVKELMGK
jgi:indole-3-glycerol phosphate synthase